MARGFLPRDLAGASPLLDSKPLNTAPSLYHRWPFHASVDSFRNIGDTCLSPASQCVRSLISASAAASTTRRGSAEGESPSAGVQGVSPWFKNTPLGRAGGSNHAHVAARTPTLPIAHNASQRHPATKRKPRSAASGLRGRSPSGGKRHLPTVPESEASRPPGRRGSGRAQSSPPPPTA